MVGDQLATEQTCANAQYRVRCTTYFMNGSSVSSTVLSSTKIAFVL